MIRLVHITEEGEPLQQVRVLFRQYLAELNENLCFQGFDTELNNPLYKYGPPKGALFVAYNDDETCGCVALQPLQEQGVCEMKRLYVLPQFRHLGIGKMLAEVILQQAKGMGYTIMKLDTLDRLVPAIKLYEQYGFVTSTAYYANPLPGVVYMEKRL